MKNFVRILICTFVLLFTGLACESAEFLSLSSVDIETGTISFVSPADDDLKYHEDEVQVPLIIGSTYETPKDAVISIDGFEYIHCLLEPQTNSVCPSVPLMPPSEPGTHTISVSIVKLDGSVETIETMVEWRPYTDLDKMALSLSGDGGSLEMGYAVLLMVITAVSTIILMIIGAVFTHGSGLGLLTGGAVGFLFGLLGAGYYALSNASPLMGGYIITIIIAAVIFFMVMVIILMSIKNGHSFTVVKAQRKTFDPNTGNITSDTGLLQPFWGPAPNGPNINRALEGGKTPPRLED